MNKLLLTDPKLTAELPHKYLGVFGIFWVLFLALNLFTSLKTFSLFGLEFSAGVIAYPLTYIFADIFTEVYGYRVTRKIVWSGIVGVIIISIFAYIYAVIPPSPNFPYDEAFNIVFKSSPILVLILIAGYFGGEFTNSFALAKLKIINNGKFEEFRYVLSTFVGQLVDNTIFFGGTALIISMFTSVQIIPLVVSSVLFCTFVEMAMIPVTKRVIKYIKEKEGIDTYDIGTNFNPFKLL